VAAQNLAASRVYDVFVFNNGGTPTFDFYDASSEPQHMPDTTAGNIGVEVRNSNPSGSPTPDSTRTFVGKIATTATPNFQAQGVGVISWFGRRPLAAGGGTISSATTTSATLVELNTGARASFLAFSGSVIISCAAAYFTTSNSSDNVGFGFLLDGTASTLVQRSASTVACPVGLSSPVSIISEGQHYVTPGGEVAGGATGTFVGFGVTVQTFG
jgi:hypothetical protein